MRKRLAHICQHMTRPPRMLAGTFSAEKTGAVVALGPIPNPRRRRQIFFFGISGLEVDGSEEGHHQKLWPCLTKGLTEDSSDAKDPAEEKSATTAEEVIERIRKPAAHEA